MVVIMLRVKGPLWCIDTDHTCWRWTVTMGAPGLNFNNVNNLDRMHPRSPSPQFTVNKYDHWLILIITPASLQCEHFSTRSLNSWRCSRWVHGESNWMFTWSSDKTIRLRFFSVQMNLKSRNQFGGGLSRTCSRSNWTRPSMLITLFSRFPIWRDWMVDVFITDLRSLIRPRYTKSATCGNTRSHHENTRIHRRNTRTYQELITEIHDLITKWDTCGNTGAHHLNTRSERGTDLEVGGSVQQIREVEVLDVVSGNDVRIHFSHELRPSLHQSIKTFIETSNKQLLTLSVFIRL